MVMITAAEKSTQHHCVWLRPRGLEGGIIYKFGQIDMVCDLVQAKCFEVDTYESDHTQRCSIAHNTPFVCDIFMAWSEGVPNIFDTKNKGET